MLILSMQPANDDVVVGRRVQAIIGIIDCFFMRIRTFLFDLSVAMDRLGVSRQRAGARLTRSFVRGPGSASAKATQPISHFADVSGRNFGLARSPP